MPSWRFRFLIICWLQFSTVSRNAIQPRAHCEIIAQNCSLTATVWVQLEIFISCALFVHSLRKDLETIRIWAEKIICKSMKIMWKLSARMSHFATISWSAQHSTYHYYSIRRTTCYALIIAHNSRGCHGCLVYTFPHYHQRSTLPTTRSSLAIKFVGKPLKKLPAGTGDASNIPLMDLRAGIVWKPCDIKGWELYRHWHWHWHWYA